jgi:hypothetical protein
MKEKDIIARNIVALLRCRERQARQQLISVLDGIANGDDGAIRLLPYAANEHREARSLATIAKLMLEDGSPCI